jgi:hypothetical protein
MLTHTSRKALIATGVAAALLTTGSQALAQHRTMSKPVGTGGTFRVNPPYVQPVHQSPIFYPPVYKPPVYFPPVHTPPYWGGFPKYPTWNTGFWGFPTYPSWGGGFWGSYPTWFYPKSSWWWSGW